MSRIYQQILAHSTSQEKDQGSRCSMATIDLTTEPDAGQLARQVLGAETLAEARRLFDPDGTTESPEDTGPR